MGQRLDARPGLSTRRNATENVGAAPDHLIAVIQRLGDNSNALCLSRWYRLGRYRKVGEQTLSIDFRGQLLSGSRIAVMET